MQYPIRCPGLNLTVPMPLLPMEKPAVMKCPVCCPYMKVSQMMPFPKENMRGWAQQSPLQCSHDMLSQSEAVTTLGVSSHSHCYTGEASCCAVAALLIFLPLPFKQPQSATVQAPSGSVEADYVNWKYGNMGQLSIHCQPE